MLHIDTRELHPGLIMPACRLSRAEEREREREMKEERWWRRSRRGRWRRRRRRSGKGEVKGREEQQAVQPRVPGGAQMFIPVDLSSPLAPQCPSSCSPICPLHLRFLRRRSAPSAIQCCGALHLRYACSCCSDALTVASQSSPFSPTDGNMTGSIARTKVPDIPRCIIYFRIERLITR